MIGDTLKSLVRWTPAWIACFVSSVIYVAIVESLRAARKRKEQRKRLNFDVRTILK